MGVALISVVDVGIIIRISVNQQQSAIGALIGRIAPNMVNQRNWLPANYIDYNTNCDRSLSDRGVYAVARGSSDNTA